MVKPFATGFYASRSPVKPSTRARSPHHLWRAVHSLILEGTLRLFTGNFPLSNGSTILTKFLRSLRNGRDYTKIKFRNINRTKQMIKILLAGLFTKVHGLAARDKLQQDNSETIDIRLQSQLATHGILRRAIPVSPHNPSRDMGFVPNRPKLGQPKIRKLHIVLVVQQYVRRLKVTVYYRRVRFTMQVLKPAGRTHRNFQPRAPTQRPLIGL
ncbi:ERD (early-responsive to dehydration stress)family protein [Striga asiatica]|uniref:ERD (Early-responsive to dehydration stress)family protein n=1 Tax=Striga asiatica TaxID=4170 RepID=A0A5A7QG52_STRAF|nr:ERD (early-responsive to dehydration stress)family protein [Striga asiatica]